MEEYTLHELQASNGVRDGMCYPMNKQTTYACAERAGVLDCLILSMKAMVRRLVSVLQVEGQP